MAIISPTIKVYISIKLNITENIISGEIYSPNKVTTY